MCVEVPSKPKLSLSYRDETVNSNWKSSSSLFNLTFLINATACFQTECLSNPLTCYSHQLHLFKCSYRYASSMFSCFKRAISIFHPINPYLNLFAWRTGLLRKKLTFTELLFSIYACIVNPQFSSVETIITAEMESTTDHNDTTFIRLTPAQPEHYPLQTA